MSNIGNIRLRTDARPEQLIKELLLSPLIYIRLLGILFSIIVFGCVADKVLITPSNSFEVCFYHGNFSACSFAIAVGVIGFILCLAFLVKDFLYIVLDFSDTPVVKKVLVLVDIVANAFWWFMWFVCFCFTADQLRQSISIISDVAIRNCANSGVAFSFFAMLAWGAIVGVNIFYFIRIIKGRDSGAPGSGGPSGYASFPEGQESDTGDAHKSQYSPPEY